jgi:chromosome segregation ATPase
MNNSEETLEQSTLNNAILQAIAELSKNIDDHNVKLSKKIDDYKNESDARFESIEQKMDEYKKESDVQFEAIRQGIVHNSVSFDRLKAEVLLLRADVKELKEEVRHNKKVLV